jgi:hypothetical protein
MGAETTGRKVGIGMRLFARAVQQGAAAASAASRSSQTAKSPAAAQSNYHPSAAFAAPTAANQLKTKAGGVARGAKRFGEAIWGPVARTGGVLWLEITGLFFALFALFFAQNVYKFRQNYAGGPEHAHFLVYAALTVLFTAFTFTQFYKARRKEKKGTRDVGK